MIKSPPRPGCVPSYYEATRAYDDTYQKLRQDVVADVVVLGGGYTGLSAALHLAEAGRRVVLLEAERVGWGASGRNGGIFIPGYRKDAGYLISVFGMADAQRLWGMAEEALALQRALIEKHQIDCDYTPSGWVHAAMTRGAIRDARDEVTRLTEAFGYRHAELLDRDGVRALANSSRYVGGMVDHQGGHLHPLNYALGLARAAAGAGATLHENSRVIAIDRTGLDIRVITTNGTVRAANCLLATDAFAPEIDQTFAPYIMGVQNFLVATERLGDHMAQILPAGSAVSDTKFVLDYYRPTADGRLVFGGGEKWTPGDPDSITKIVRPHLSKTFPTLAEVRIDYAWSGTVSLTLTRNPSIGRRENLWWALGYSGQGVVTAGYAGAIVAAAIEGDDAGYDLLSRFPAATFPGGMLARNPLYVAGMAYYALRDRLGLALQGRVA